MRASICRFVVLLGVESNGTDAHPAVINQAKGEDIGDLGMIATVNLTAFIDGRGVMQYNDVKLFDDSDQAAAYRQQDPKHAPVAFWPMQVNGRPHARPIPGLNNEGPGGQKGPSCAGAEGPAASTHTISGAGGIESSEQVAGVQQEQQHTGNKDEQQQVGHGG